METWISLGKAVQIVIYNLTTEYQKRNGEMLARVGSQEIRLPGFVATDWRLLATHYRLLIAIAATGRDWCPMSAIRATAVTYGTEASSRRAIEDLRAWGYIEVSSSPEPGSMARRYRVLRKQAA